MGERLLTILNHKKEKAYIIKAVSNEIFDLIEVDYDGIFCNEKETLLTSEKVEDILTALLTLLANEMRG